MPLMLERGRAVRRVQALLERRGVPRLQMLLLVALTGAAGFVASFLLLRLGLSQMWLRYPVAFGLAYLVFLLLLGLWLRTRARDYADLADVPLPSGGSPGPSFEGQGGAFGGGGASGRFELQEAGAAAGADGAEPAGSGLGAAADADELAIPLFVLGVLAAFVLSSFWIVHSAPILFAELLVDGVLSASLYRRLRGLGTRHWLQTAVRRTWVPFAAAAAVAALAGWGMGLQVPGASSVGDVFTSAPWTLRP